MRKWNKIGTEREQNCFLMSKISVMLFNCVGKSLWEKSKDHGNFILLNNSVHINNSPSPTLQQRAAI